MLRKMVLIHRRYEKTTATWKTGSRENYTPIWIRSARLS